MQNALSKAEWAIMSALWTKPRQTISGIIETMGNGIGWKYNTYVTYLKRMCDKGYVAFEQLGRDKFYFAALKRDDCLRAESDTLLDKLDSRGAKELLVCMIKGSGLTEDDRRELRALLGELSEAGDEV